MKLTIDGRDISIDESGISTFSDAIKHVEETKLSRSDVITKIVLNGEEIDEGQEIGLGAFSVDEIVSLAIETRNRIHLAHEALNDAQDYLPQLSTLLEQSAGMIREGSVAEGLTLASEALDFIGAFGEVLEGIRISFRLDFAEVKIDDFNLLEKMQNLGKLAQDILKAAQEENWTLFADLTEYELSPLLYEWMAVIPSLVNLLPAENGNKGGDDAL
ncbi:MAG TPA: hypothetical protein ENN67_08370 [Firmicutes bacterium]|nr:hypothetical protein [Bacillota bacterium]